MADDNATATAPAASKEEVNTSGDDMAVDKSPADAGDEPATDADAPKDEKEPDVEATGDSKDTADDADGDVKMADDAGEDVVSKPEVANGAPAAAEKKADKARRKSAGVPEHKSKKLNKKKSKAEFHTDAKPGELYLARMKGHPAWPSIIADDDMLPELISKSRPVTAPNADGTWRRPDYAPDGKRHNERTFAIMFLYTNEFAWIPNGDLTPITPEECKDVSEKNKSKSLINAFQEAAEGHDLEYYKSILSDHANALAEEEQARADREAEKARKAEKKAKRKSEANVVDDEMDVDESGESKPKSKKRKKEAADDDEKPAKTPKTPKLKLSNPKTPATNEKSGKKKTPAAKPAKKKGSKAPGSDDDVDTPADEERHMTAEERHNKLQDEIRYCRHKLQRALLSRDNVPSDEEVGHCEPWLKRLENHPDLPADIITNTKIHKVLKGIIKLPSIPREEEFSFKKRSHELWAKWSKIIADSEKPTANGEKKSEGAEDKEGSEKKDSEDKSEDKADEDPAEKKDDEPEADEDKPKEADDDSEKANGEAPEKSEEQKEDNGAESKADGEAGKSAEPTEEAS